MWEAATQDRHRAPESQGASAGPEHTPVAPLPPGPEVNGAAAAQAAQDPQRMTPVFGQYAEDDGITAAGSSSSAAAARLRTNLPPGMTDLHAQIAQYNKLEPDAGDHQPQLRALNQIDRSVYAWFRDSRAENLNDVPHAGEMRALLDGTGREHQGIVREIRQNVRSGKGTELPIDTSGMDAAQQGDAQALWGSIARQEGRIKVHGTTKDGSAAVDAQAAQHGFEDRSYANLAKIMQHPHGRGTLAYLDQGDDPRHDVDIRPGKNPDTAATQPADADLAFRKDKNRWQRAASAVGKMLHVGKPPGNYPDLDGAADLPGDYMRGTLDPPAGDKGFCIDGRRYKRSAGSGSTVRMPAEASERRSLGPDGSEIISPEFVVLGHELGHAARMRGGANAGNLDTGRVYKGEKPGQWKNAEEYINVNGSENPLRAEHGISERGPYLSTVLTKRNDEIMRRAITAMQQKGLDDAGKQQLGAFTQNGKALGDDATYKARLRDLEAKSRELAAARPRSAGSAAGSAAASVREAQPEERPSPAASVRSARR